MNIFNLFMSLFNSRRVRRLFKFSRYRRNNRGWLFLSMLGLGVGAVLSIAAGRNTNMMKSLQKFFQNAQYKINTLMPPRLNAAMMEFAEEITPVKPKKNNNKV